MKHFLDWAKGSLFFLCVFLITVSNANAENNKEFLYSYTGDVQEFIAPYTGTYKLEVWGAQGGQGDALSLGGKGGYSKGYYHLKKGDKVYIYVGGAGSTTTSETEFGGYNGGGAAQIGSYNKPAGNGGGATDIRRISGNWSDLESLQSRIIVAGGGGGGGSWYTGASYDFTGGAGGGFSGINGFGSNGNIYGSAGSQTAAGFASGHQSTTSGAFGIGGNGLRDKSSAGGGGGGYYGGGGSYCAGGGGGSGYIEGLLSYQDDDPITIAGNAEMPNYDDSSTMIGNTANGYAKISLVKADYQFDFSIEGVTISPDPHGLVSTYYVTIPTVSYEAEIKYQQYGNLAVLGAGKVTLMANTIKNFVVVDEEGNAHMYELHIINSRAIIETLSFSEISFAFESFKTEYYLQVPANVTQLTPLITTLDQYEIIKNDPLEYGINKIQIKATGDGKQETIYTFYVTREYRDEEVSVVYDYTGNVQEFTAPETGIYKLEVWGAQGGQGDSISFGGKGGYSKGYYKLNKGQTVYIYVGGAGSTIKSGTGSGGYNGGGSAQIGSYNKPAGSGGGATDIRLVSGNWNHLESLQSRIIVAGGGGGGGAWYTGASYDFTGGAGGGLSGKNGINGVGGNNVAGSAGTQTAAGYASGQQSQTIGAFGIGGNGLSASSSSGGGGGGYYGGGGSYCAGAGGGSGYIDSTLLTFLADAPITLDGNTQIPTHDGMDHMVGNVGNGYAKITMVGSSEENELNDLSSTQGTLSPTFQSNVYEYTLQLENDVTEFTLAGTAKLENTNIIGLGAVPVSQMNFDHTITLVSENGFVNLYVLHVQKTASDYKNLSGFEINGESIINFEPEVYEYSIELPYHTEYIYLNALKGQSGQMITGDGLQIFHTNELTKKILVVSESGNENSLYTFHFTREKSTRLKNIDLNNPYISFDFDPETFTYDLKVPNGVLNLNILTTPYYEGTTIAITGNDYIGGTEATITIVSTLEGIPSTTYELHLTKTTIQVEEKYGVTGNYETFQVPTSGYYQIELWGASGGNNLREGTYINNNQGGKGAYTKGTILLSAGDSLYLYVGGQGIDGEKSKIVPGGFNGGGQGDYDHLDDEAAGSGGGASDIRLVSGNWDDFDSLKSRIMVAAGGGGAAYNANGGYAGGLNGENTVYSKGGTQTTGYAFGKGQDGVFTDYNVDVAGGGGGYYGGYAKSSGGASTYRTAGAGGSSFISGHYGSDAITEDSIRSNILHTGNSTHYSGKYFTDTLMIDGAGYEWTNNRTTISPMPNPTGGYYPDGEGNVGDGAIKIKLLKETSSDNYLKSITLNDGNVELPFSVSQTEYTVMLTETDTTLKIDAEAMDSNAKIQGIGTIDVAPGETTHSIVVTATDGTIRTYLLTITRPGSSDPLPKTIEINKMYSYLCNRDAAYCQYVFQEDVTSYQVTVPFTIQEIELNALLKSKFQKIIYRRVDGDIKTEVENGTITIGEDPVTYEVEIMSEDQTQSIVYTYKIVRDMSGNNNLSSLKVTNPVIDFAFQPKTYEYYLTLAGEYTNFEIEAIPENRDATVMISGNTSIGLGMNDCIITVTAPNGDTKTYILHVYKEQDSNVFLQTLKVKDENQEYTLSPEFSKLLNNYTLNVGSDVKEVNLEALAESPTAIVTGNGVKTLKSGINLFEIKVESASGDSNVYDLTIYKEKNHNSNLLHLEVEGYTFTESFDPTIKEYYVNIPKEINRLNILVTPEESTTTYTINGNNNLNKEQNDIVIMVVAEDRSYQTYIIHVSKSLSDNNYLRNIILSDGALNELFNKTQNEYTVTVENDVSQIEVTGVLEDESATLTGNGTYSLTPGENKILLNVTSEIGDTNVYTLTVTRKKNEDTSLKEIQNNRGSEVIKVDESHYLINVQHEVDSITVNGIPTSPLSTITGNGTYSLQVGENHISFLITSEAGTTKEYDVKVVRDLSTNDDLDYLYVKEGGLNPRFEETTIFYEVKVPNEVSVLTIEAITEDPNATYTIIGNDGLEVGVPKEVIVRVTAPKGNTKDYTLKVTRQEATTENLALQSLETNRGDVIPTFQPDTLNYELEVENDITDITVTATALTEMARVAGNGTYSLQVGKNVIAIFVIGSDGVQRDYQVVVTRKQSSNANLSKLVVKGSSLSPTFSQEQTEYQIKTSNSQLDFTTVQPVEEEASYEIRGNENFIVGENTVQITVTAPDRTTKKVYILTVTKEGSSNNNLSSLEVEGFLLTPTFHKGITLYTVTVPNTIHTISIRATAEDPNATVTGTGSKSVLVGTNYYEVAVTSEKGTVKKYMIVVSKDGSDNNYLSQLYVNQGVLTPSFDKEILDYTVTVPHEVSQIEVNGAVEVISASTTGFQTYSLEVGTNDIEIPVISESGLIRIYKVHVVRQEMNSANLINLEIDNYELDSPFAPDLLEYFVNVNNEVNSLIITATPEDSNAIVEIIGNKNFAVGMNEVKIKVTAKDGITVKEYVLSINRNLSTNNYLSSLDVSKGSLTPDFSPETLEYEVEVENDVTSIDIMAIPQDSASIVTSGNGTHTLSTGKNTISIKVKSSIGVYRTYLLQVTRKQSNNAYLKELIVTTTDNQSLNLNEIFDKTSNHYTMNVSSEIEYLKIFAQAEEPYASIVGTGVKTIKSGLNSFEISVTAPDGTLNIYCLDITKEKSSNNRVTMITPSVGSLNQTFDPIITEYTLTVSPEEMLLSFHVILESEKAIVQGSEVSGIPDGTSDRMITITAEDGSEQQYIFHVIKETMAEARLESLKVAGYEFAFDPDTFSYQLSVSPSKETLLESEITAVAKDSEAIVHLMGDLSLRQGMNNVYTIEVIAKDGYTVQEYKLNITRDNQEYLLRNNQYRIEREETYIIGMEPNEKLEDFLLSFENDPSMITFYNKEGIKVEDLTEITSTGMYVKLEKSGVIYDQLLIIVLGDVNGDGKINIADKTLINNHILKIELLTEEKFLAGDINRDGIINVGDKTLLNNYILKIISSIN